LVRHADALALLKQSAVYLDTSDLSFDILQLVFVDRSEDYVKAVGCKSDRLFQVEVPIPSEETVDFGSAPTFVKCIAQRLKLAVGLCGLPKVVGSQLIETISHFNIG
jgi:hypothetical protein